MIKILNAMKMNFMAMKAKNDDIYLQIHLNK